MAGWALALLALLLAACAGPLADPAREPAAVRATDFRPTEIREPAVFVRVALAPGAFSERERANLAAAYEGALLEGFNARAVPPRDAQRVTAGKLDGQAAVARARQVGADHAILVDVQVARGEPVFCREARRPFRAPAVTWAPRLEVLRASDGASRVVLQGPAVDVADVEPDCDAPQDSRRRTSSETVLESVSRLLTRLLGS